MEAPVKIAGASREEGAQGGRPSYDVVVCGGGPAGMAAALAASRCGASVLLLERGATLGGVLPQCVHDGFGLYLAGESMTGPRFAELLDERVRAASVEIALETNVLSLAEDAGGLLLVCSGLRFGGAARIHARAVVIATGCRERTLGQLRIPGTRPAGILTAGAAQQMVNVRNRMPGDKVVILGSGDVGLIMARRLKIEGADVRMVVGQEATGLYRNHVQCIREMGISFRYGWTVSSVHGRGRLKGVTVAPLNGDGSVDGERREYVRCNTLLVAAGLIPDLDIDGLDAVLGGPSPVFLAGNAAQIHDVVDGAVAEGLRIGAKAAWRAIRPGADAVRAQKAAEDIEAYVGARMGREGARANLEASGALDAFGERDERLLARDVIGKGRVPARCSGCPAGCAVEVVFCGDGASEVEGCRCEAGRETVLQSFAEPRRIFTGTVRSGSSLLPVRTSDVVPVDCFGRLAKICRRMSLEGPVNADEVVAANVGDLEVDLLASCSSRFMGGC